MHQLPIPWVGISNMGWAQLGSSLQCFCWSWLGSHVCLQSAESWQAVREGDGVTEPFSHHAARQPRLIYPVVTARFPRAAQEFFKSLFVSHLLGHWPNEIMWPIPDSRGGETDCTSWEESSLSPFLKIYTNYKIQRDLALGFRQNLLVRQGWK